MSSSQRIPASQAQEAANVIQDDLHDLCEQITIAGSLRRKKQTVGDVELVAHPSSAQALLARLDKWVIGGRIRKAIYPDGSTRWGSHYRGFVYCDIRFEVFLADADNWGYQLFLRTGPGDANAYVMRQCIAYRSPYRAMDGYWQVDGRRLSVPDETEMFRLLGMTYIAPKDRTLARYQQLLNPPRWTSVWTYADMDVPEQQSMF